MTFIGIEANCVKCSVELEIPIFAIDYDLMAFNWSHW